MFCIPPLVIRWGWVVCWGGLSTGLGCPWLGCPGLGGPLGWVVRWVGLPDYPYPCCVGTSSDQYHQLYLLAKYLSNEIILQPSYPLASCVSFFETRTTV